jgi:hypothetical protein
MPAKPLFGPALPSRSFRRILCFSGGKGAPALGVALAPIKFPLNFGKAADHPVNYPETGFGVKGDGYEADSSSAELHGISASAHIQPDGDGTAIRESGEVIGRTRFFGESYAGTFGQRMGEHSRAWTLPPTVFGITHFTNFPIVIGERSRCEPEKTGRPKGASRVPVGLLPIIVRSNLISPISYLFTKLANPVLLMAEFMLSQCQGNNCFRTVLFL